eukprot:jgi/Chrzof1/4476/Cz14g14190.t1
MLHIQTLLAAEQDRQASFNCLLDQITTQQQQQHQQQDLQQQQHSQPRKPNTASNMDNHQHTLVVHGVSLGCTAGVDTAHDDTRYQVGRRQLLQLTGNSSTPGVTADDTTLMTTKHNNTTSSSSSSRHSISSVDSSAGAGGTDAAGGAGSSTSSSHLLPYRIIGGVQALKDRFKFACSLRDGSGSHYCACALIAPSVVLTAAHCVNQTDPALRNPAVEIGRYYRTAANSSANDFDHLWCSSSVVHPQWSFSHGLYDIALCFLNDSSRFPPIQLATDALSLPVGTNLTVLGWGSTSQGGPSSLALLGATIQVQDPQACNASYGGRIRDAQICAGLPQGGADACQGDSGGPLILEGSEPGTDVQVGIVSFGAGCGQPGQPGVYTDVRKYRQYIAGVLKSNGVQYEAAGYANTTDNPSVTWQLPNSSMVLSSGAASNAATNSSSTLPVNSSKSSSDVNSFSNSSTAATDVCVCSTTGSSGSNHHISVIGCNQHGLAYGDTSYYCYVLGGTKCAAATASTAYPGAAWRPCMPSGLQQIRISSDSGANAKLANGGPKTQAKSPAVVRARLGGSAAATQLRLSGNAASLEAAAKPPVVTMLQEMDSSNQLGASILRAASGFWQGFNAGLASAAVQTSQSG